jgi:hypothetical protein
MARWIVAGLIVLNLILGAGIYLRFGEKTAQAQIGRPAGDFATVAGQANGFSVIYILDVNNGVLAALQPDIASRSIKRVAVRNVGDDIKRLNK